MTLHGDIFSEFESSILSGERAPGSQMPSEHEIRELHGVSRATAQRVLNDLSNAGYIVRRRGVGSFVAETRRKLNLLSLVDPQAARAGVEGDHEVLSARVTTASRAILNLAGAAPDTVVIEIRRRKLDERGRPQALETHVLLFGLVPELLDEDLKHLIVMRYLHDHGVEVDANRVHLEPVIITDEESELLEIPPGAPAIQRRRELRNARGDVIETTATLTRPDAADFYVEIPIEHG